MKRMAIVGARVFVDGDLLRRDVIVEAGRIAALVEPGSDLLPQDERIDASGHLVAPGFIDTHVHGGLGRNFMEASDQALEVISTYLAAGGVTSCLATTTSTGPETLEQVCAFMAAETGPSVGRVEVLGVHLEGPFIEPRFRGVHVERHLRLPASGELKRLVAAAGDALRIVTLAPELPGAGEAINILTKSGVGVSLGHSGASYEQAREAVSHGVTRGTHLFNALPGIHHRELGPIVPLLEGNAFVEIIGDGRHVHLPLVGLVIRIVGPDRVVLISDGTDVAGQPDGHYRRWEGTDVVLMDGQAKTPKGGLAGGTTRLNEAVRNLVVRLGVSIPDALTMASLTPARSIGVEHRKGSLAPGKDADVVVLNEDLEVLVTVAMGRVIHDVRSER